MEKLFTEADFEEMLKDGMSEEDIEVIKDAMALAETVDLLPNDITKLTDLIEALPDEYGQAVEAISALAEKNPRLYAEFMALVTVVVADHEETTLPVKKVDPALAHLSPEELEVAEQRFFQTIGSMSKEQQQKFMDLIRNITPEQKADLINQLK